MKKQTFLIIFLWLVIISIFVLTQNFTLLTGKEVLLKTIPVDPRDLLRGDYVILNYEIGQIHNKNFAYNSTVYVSLNTDDNNIGYVKDISYIKPSDSLYLKGKVRNHYRIDFGIESYFVKEGTGRTLEKNLRNGALVKIVIDKNGNAKIKGFTN